MSLIDSQSEFDVEGMGVMISFGEVIQGTLLVIIKYRSFKMIDF